MSHRDEIKKPLDHLPPQDERDDIDEPEYPDVGAPAGGSPVSPETAAEPEDPNRHGLDGLPRQGA